MGKDLFYYLAKRVGYAIGDFALIEQGDRILVAVSGGKDSLALLDFLIDKRRKSPAKFELFAYHVVTDPADSQKVKSFLEDRDIEYRIDYDAMKDLDLNKVEKNRCFLCSWYRRKAIFLTAAKLNCNKVALGHNMDDVVQTLLMNMFFQASISAMCPKQVFFDGEITVIRPLFYIRDYELKRLAKERNYPSLPNCPWAKDNNRELIKRIIAEVEKQNPKVNVVKQILLSLFSINKDYLPQYAKKK